MIIECASWRNSYVTSIFSNIKWRDNGCHMREKSAENTSTCWDLYWGASVFRELKILMKWLVLIIVIFLNRRKIKVLEIG